MAFKKGRLLAVDIGTCNIRIAEVHCNKEGISIHSIGEAPLSLEGAGEGNSTSVDIIYEEAIHRLVKENTVPLKKYKRSVVSIPGEQIGLKQISIIKLDESELESSLMFEARKHLPVKGDELVLDFQVLGEEENNLDVLLSVTTRQTIENLKNVLENSEITPDIFEVPTLAVMNALLLSRGETEPEHTGVVTIGGSSTTLSFVTKEKTFLTREIPLGGKQFTEEIQKEKKCSEEEAELEKIQKGVIPEESGLSADSASGGLSLALASSGTNPAVTALTRELQRSIRFFLKEGNMQSLEKIYLAGGSAGDQTLKNHLEKELRIPLEVIDPFKINGLKTTIPENERSRYTELVGLGLRGVYELFSN